VHAAWDAAHRASPAWLAAQASDGAFVTEYGAKKPALEDLAESALFAYTLLHHPERIPAADAARIRAAIPARIDFVATLLPPGEPIFHAIGPRDPCDSSATTFTIGGDDPGPEVLPEGCSIDLERVGQLSDVLSNALLQAFGKKEDRVRAFLDGARARALSPEELRSEAAAAFDIDRARLDAGVLAFQHVNCTHGPLEGAPASPPVRDPTDPTGLRPLLYTITTLLALLLAVSTTTLAVVVRHSRSAS